MFKSIGCKFLDPNFKEDDEGGSGSAGGSSASATGSGGVKLDAKKATETTKKKGCC